MMTSSSVPSTLKGNAMKLEVRIPISPLPAWVNRTLLIAASIREFYPDALIRVSVGDKAGPNKSNEHALKVFGTHAIDYRWVPQSEFLAWAGTECEYLATMMDRYKPPFNGSHILMLDADVICTKNFEELFVLPGISGMMTHVPPLSRVDWGRVFKSFGLPEPMEWHEHSGWGTMVTGEAWRYSPAYFNSGMVFGTREAFDALADPYFRSLTFMRLALKNTYWADQIGLALAMAAARIQTNILPMRYNFANQESFDKAHPGELADVRFIHYMRTDIVHRDRDFETTAALQAMVARADLTGSNEALRKRVGTLLPVLERVPL